MGMPSGAQQGTAWGSFGGPSPLAPAWMHAFMRQRSLYGRLRRARTSQPQPPVQASMPGAYGGHNMMGGLGGPTFMAPNQGGYGGHTFQPGTTYF